MSTKYRVPASAKPKDEKLPYKLGRPRLVIASTALIFILSQAMIAFVVEIGVRLAHTTYNKSILAQFLFVILSAILYILFVRWILKQRRLSWKAIALGRKPRLGDVTSAVWGFLILLAIFAVINFILLIIAPSFNSQKQDLGFNHISGLLDYSLAFAALVIVPPIGEEILMRGYLYSGLRYWWTRAQAAFVTSGLFALPHLLEGQNSLLWAAALDTFILSYVLIYLRERTGALYAGMMVHAFNNILAFGVYFNGLALLMR